MITECKNSVPLQENHFYAFVFISIFVHLALFWQVKASLTSPSDLLLGKRGGPVEATEVSFFPSFGKSLTQTKVFQSSAVDLPTKQTTRTTAAAGSDSVSKKGIGAGGTNTQYQAVLHAYLDSVKIFPRHLRDLGLAGVVRVRFEVTPEGYLENIRLGQDSEAPTALQNEAIRFLKKLDRVPLPPDHFSQADLQFELPLRYELRS